MTPLSESTPSETVGVLSDTHLSTCTPAFLRLCEQHFGDCARLLHAGDLVHIEVLRALERRWQVDAVRGNMDFAGGLGAVPRRRVVQVGGLDVGLLHGDGAPGGIESRVLAAFGDAPPPVIVYGHSHTASDTVLRGVRLLNPGSPTDQRWAPYRSLARLTISGARVDFRIIPLG